MRKGLHITDRCTGWIGVLVIAVGVLAPADPAFARGAGSGGGGGTGGGGAGSAYESP